LLQYFEASYLIREVALDENPTLHEDAPPTAQEISDNLPPLAPSTNPLFPNAIVKKPPNTHAKTSTVPKPALVPKAPMTPRVVTGKNAPVRTPSFWQLAMLISCSRPPTR
jgi:DNA polymerase epsilon subunit 4